MKIEIKDEDDIITISDEHLDSNNFVEISICGEVPMIVSLDDIFSALYAFKKKREFENTRDIIIN